MNGKSEIEEFRASEDGVVKWYGCGPTVYDYSHLGHARNYMTFDTIRRVLDDYMGYSVFMVMNVTDVDDKIIAKAAELKVDFVEHARKFEELFWRDMSALNVRKPNLITRVSEYMREIIRFIEKIMANGYAYESNGSVYFDLLAYAKKYNYGRMEPGAAQDLERVLEGEGALGDNEAGDKTHPSDFALWKKSKSEEPCWASPWGNGRPGWHIECSAMATEALGFPIDIHSGGVDLRFPHHENELAQTEAAYDKADWVRYFMHSGHLNIRGAKMAKSLKNFLSIQETLNAGTSARALRLLFLKHKWDAPMNFTAENDASLTEARELDRGFITFFASAQSYFRTNDSRISLVQRWGPAAAALNESFLQFKKHVDAALRSNFDFPKVVTSLQAIVQLTRCHLDGTNKLALQTVCPANIENGGAASITRTKKTDFLTGNLDCGILQPVNCSVPTANAGEIPVVLLRSMAGYVFKILKVLGVTTGTEETFDFTCSANSAANSAEFDSMTDLVIECRKRIRDTARSLNGVAKQLKGDDHLEIQKLIKKEAGDLFAFGDEIRNEKLVSLSVALEDCPDGSFKWSRI